MECAADSVSPLALELVLAHSWNPIAYQILNPGMRHWFSRASDAVVGYVACNRVRVVAGAPICRPTIVRQVAEEFEDDAARLREKVCYFHAGPRFASIISASKQHSIASIGTMPYWNPMDWNSILHSDASLRYQISRARRKGIDVVEIPAPVAAESEELRAIRRQWLDSKRLPPLHFVIEPDIFNHLSDRRLFVARRAGNIIAYLLCTPMPTRNGWFFEQWARAQTAPLGTGELLAHHAMTTFGHEGCSEVTMGLVPLSTRGLVPGAPGPLWLRALFRFMRLTANPLYNFKGLEHYKYKLRPHYSEPVYAVVNDSRFRPADVFAIAHAFAGSPLQLFAWEVVRKLLGRAFRPARRQTRRR
ncbi:MAG TPA: DUF2156 domain-containing protein [Bryobacteraceae bacterium]|nr:DUF2156 domain-containing protein [Bryobacteraceae bacterium]